MLQRPKYSDAMMTLVIQLSIGLYKFTVNTTFCFLWLCFILISFFIFSVWYFCYIDNHIAHNHGGHKSLGTRTVLGKQSWMWWCGEKILSKVVWKGKTIFFVCFKTLLTNAFEFLCLELITFRIYTIGVIVFNIIIYRFQVYLTARNKHFVM